MPPDTLPALMAAMFLAIIAIAVVFDGEDFPLAHCRADFPKTGWDRILWIAHSGFWIAVALAAGGMAFALGFAGG